MGISIDQQRVVLLLSDSFRNSIPVYGMQSLQSYDGVPGYANRH